MSDDFFSIMASGWQSSGGEYKADPWDKVSHLEAGSIVYGLYPKPSEYFTDADTVMDAVSTGRAASLSALLQVRVRYDSVRAGVRPYRALRRMTVATSRCEANGAHGGGGGTQFMIPKWEGSLEPFPESQIYFFADDNGKGFAAA